jgi:hypothetical protein
MGKRRNQSLARLPNSALSWPWWKLFASTVAFAVWAAAIPPLVTSDAGKIVIAFGALFVSTLLTLLGAVVDPREALYLSVGLPKDEVAPEADSDVYRPSY